MTAYCTWHNISVIQAFYQALQITASMLESVSEIRSIKPTQLEVSQAVSLWQQMLSVLHNHIRMQMSSM